MMREDGMSIGRIIEPIVKQRNSAKWRIVNGGQAGSEGV